MMTQPERSDDSSWPARTIEIIGWFCLLLVLGVAIYYPCLHGSLLWDDDAHVLPTRLRTWAGLGEIWFSLHSVQQYYPGLYTAFWVEAKWWGDSTLGYHLANVVLHATSALLIGGVMRKLGLRGAKWASLLFLVHPVCVESVAWITEQKNTLSTLWYLAAALVFLVFHDRRTWRLYAVATIFFAFALLSKSVTVTLPMALLGVIWWKEGRLRFRESIVPLIPWLILGASFGLLTAWNERSFVGADGADFQFTFLQRVLLASRVAMFYFGKLVWPSNLMFTYPRWTIDAGSLVAWFYFSTALVIFVALVVLGRKTRGPIAVLIIYLATLFPALGFLNVYPFIFSFVADHFQYLAIPCIVIGVSAWLAHWAQRRGENLQRAMGVLALAIVVLLGDATFLQAGMYRDAYTLYTRTLEKNPDAWMAHCNLGVLLGKDPAKREEALGHLKTALALKDNSSDVHLHLANAYARNPDEREKARQHYEIAIHLNPISVEAHNNLGKLLATRFHDLEGAVTEFRAAIAIRNQTSEAHANLGAALATNPKNRGESIEEYRKALVLDATLADAHLGLARVLATQPADERAAIEEYETFLMEDPSSASAHFELANLLSRDESRRADAIGHYETALKLEPDRIAAEVKIKQLRATIEKGEK